ncbi:hypothetical protein ACHAXR_002040 [Thalassiosira sp. AJA248-18]
MATATATHQPLRIVSRRAQLLLQKHRANQGGGSSAKSGAKSAPKKDDTSWPKSLRYTFYAVCVVSVPFSIGQAIAQSPRLREWMLDDDIEEEGVGSSSSSSTRSGFSSGELISLVRSYWGVDDYVPPVDRPKLKHAVPGRRNEWQEDNYSSFMELLGMYTPKGDALESDVSEDNVIMPVSLENEPPSNIRTDQRILSQYLSTKTNSSGVKTRLTLLPCKNNDALFFDGSSIDDDAGYETECTLPANTSMNTLRALCKGSDAQGLRRDLMEGDPAFRSKSTSERIRTKSWNEDCHWAVSFADNEDLEEDGSVDVVGMDTSDDLVSIEVVGSSFGGNKGSASEEASKALRHSTSIHSSWSFFPELANGTTTAQSSPGAVGSKPMNSPLGSSTNASTAGSSSTSSSSTSNETLQMQRLQHQISTLEQELKDPSSLRDRDSMYEELRLAKKELRSLKPWWKRFGA